MPELPDVELFRRTLARAGVGHPIAGITAHRGRVWRTSPRTVRRHLGGHRLETTRRHGKYLFARSDDGSWLILHFGMTGFLAPYRDEDEAPEHPRLVLHFEDGRHLAYDDQRQLGRVDVTLDPDRWLEAHDVGPDALDLGEDALVAIFEDRRGVLKTTLMDQKRIAGIGNVYADEILFHAHLHPEARAGDLDRRTLRRLARAVHRTLEDTLKYHADPEEMPRTWLLPHREEGARCPRCEGSIRKTKVSGRSTYYCAACQTR